MRFMDSVIFNDESMFHVTTAGSWAAKNHVSPWNMFVTSKRWTCFAPSAKKSVWPFLLHGNDHYRYHVSGMLQQFHIPQLDEDDQGRIYFQQGAHTHYLGEVSKYLRTRFPGLWIGRPAPITWPPHSPDLTPLDFFLWGFVKDRVFLSPLPAGVVEQLQKGRQRFYVACGKKLTTGGTSAALSVEVTLNHNYPR
jgi:hypothetical protein